MKFFILYGKKVTTVEVAEASAVGRLKALLREKYDLYDVDKSGNKTLVLSFNSTPLQDDWILSDIGIPSGSTLHFYVADDKAPSLLIFCAFSNEKVALYEIHVGRARVSQLKRLVMSRTGVPCSVFRLLYEESQLFDCHDLDHYGIIRGSIVRMETWDGWNAFLNAARKGQSKQVVENLFPDNPETAEYQRRVALFIAAHFGHTDLAATMLKMGAHSDRPVGEHPARRWCADRADWLYYTAPIHQAAINGHLPVLRLFVRHNNSCVAARDGNGTTPLRLAMVHNQLDCVAYLKQQCWRKGANEDVTHAIFSKVRDWKETAKMKVAMEGDLSGKGGGRSKFRMRPPLVGSAIFVDGLHKSMQKSSNSVTRLDYRDFSDSENEPSGISIYNARAQMLRNLGQQTLSLPSIVVTGQETAIKKPLLPPLILPPTSVVPVDSAGGEAGFQSVRRLPQIQMVKKTMAAYETYSGKTCRENVLTCMDIGNSFSSKPWLSQLRLAMKVNQSTIRRPAMRRTKSDPIPRKLKFD
eukprot:m.86769 g.86769  ORF g.86769 m.86769 type:complete len:525 (+) comp36512_c1_seq4:1661-3235(+)